MTLLSCLSLGPRLRLLAQIHVPPPVPPGPYGPVPVPEQPITVPTPEEIPPHIDEPVPEPTLPIREPGVIRPPQAARRRVACARWLQ